MGIDPQEFAKCTLLKGLSQRDREAIVAAATLRHFRANTQIMVQGEPSDRLFLLRKGYARYFYTTTEGRKLTLSWVGPGEAFGLHAAAPAPLQYMVSSETVRDSEVLVWSRHVFRRYATKIPHLLDNAFLVSSTFVEWFLAAYTTAGSKSAREKLAEVVLRYGRTIGEKSEGGLLIDVTNEELASAADITKYTACRLLGEWQKKHWLSKARGKIRLIAPEHLMRESSSS